MNRLTIGERLALWLVRKRPIDDGFLPDGLQMRIAKDEALISAVSLAVIQQGLLHNLVMSLNEMGIVIATDSDIHEEMTRLVESLHASQNVMAEVAGIKDLKTETV